MQWIMAPQGAAMIRAGWPDPACQQVIECKRQTSVPSMALRGAGKCRPDFKALYASRRWGQIMYCNMAPQGAAKRVQVSYILTSKSH